MPPTPSPRLLCAAAALALALAPDAAPAQKKARASSSARKPSTSRLFGPPRPSAPPRAVALPRAAALPAPARAAVVAAPVAAGAAVTATAAGASGAPNASDGPNDPAGTRMPGRGLSSFGTWGPGARVEVDVDGVWRPGSVIRRGAGATNGRYYVATDASVYGRSETQWAPSWRVRRARGAPAALPPGRYVCTAPAAGGTSRTTLGRLRLREDGTYTGVSGDGSGAGGRYRYDAVSGAVEWAGGLRGLPGPATASRAVRSRADLPVLVVAYRARGGGGRSPAECTREGA